MLCNDKNDCLDGSDEGGQCGKLLNIINYSLFEQKVYFLLSYTSINYILFNVS